MLPSSLNREEWNFKPFPLVSTTEFTPNSKRRLLSYFKLYCTPSEIPLTLLSFFFFVFAAYCTCLSNALANRVNRFSPLVSRHSLMQSMNQTDFELPLKDPFVEFMFSSIGRGYLSSQVPDYVVSGSLLLLSLFSFSRKSASFTVLRRVFYILGAMYLIRAPVILMTFLPNPEPTCVFDNGKNIFLDAFKQLVFMKKTCGDVFFSGHSMIIWLNARIWLTYCRNRILKFLVLGYALLGLLTLPMTAFHYTIDIVVGSFLLWVIFSLYHWTIEQRIGRTTWWGQGLRRLDAGNCFYKFDDWSKETLYSTSPTSFPSPSSFFKERTKYEQVDVEDGSTFDGIQDYELGSSPNHSSVTLTSASSPPARPLSFSPHSIPS